MARTTTGEPAPYPYIRESEVSHVIVGMGKEVARPRLVRHTTGPDPQLSSGPPTSVGRSSTGLGPGQFCRADRRVPTKINS